MNKIIKIYIVILIVLLISIKCNIINFNFKI